MKVPVVIPVYNEAATVAQLVARVDAVDVSKEIIVVDDGSTADVVYGSRFLTTKEHRVLFFCHSVGNQLLTLISNMFTNLNLTDMETGFKVFRREVIQSIKLTQNRFGFEPEVTVKIARMKLRIYEVGISYYGRTYEEGKKIGWKDGLHALWCILKYSITTPHSAFKLGGQRANPASSAEALDHT